MRDERREAEIDAPEHVRDEVTGGEQEKDTQTNGGRHSVQALNLALKREFNCATN
jgi:hypothetical protein